MPRSPPKKPQKPPSQDKPTAQNHRVFDPWNSSSSGHQRAENPFAGTTTWRETRTAKLKLQFRGENEARGTAGALDDGNFSVGAFDGTCGSLSPAAEGYGSGSGSARTREGEWRWVSEEEAMRARLGVRDIRCFMGVGKRKAGEEVRRDGEGVKRVKNGEERRVEKGAITTSAPVRAPKSSTTATTASTTTKTTDKLPISTSEPEPEPEFEPEHPRQKHITTSPNNAPPPKIFTGTTIYINGSTLPQISDHKLKSLLSAHGATIAIAMARRTVSHVIIGQPGTAGQGCGGGLAAGKLQREIERGGWKGVKVVGVDW